MSSTFDTVANIIAETCDIPRENIKPESHAINDLGIDSLDFLDIAFAIDKAFGIKLPLEQWTQEVNEGKATTEQYFVLQNLCARIDELVAAKGHVTQTGMRLEYFQLIDRIVAIDLEAARSGPRRPFPTSSTIFEGHFPGYPLMPGVLLLESHGADLGLADHRRHRIYAHAVSRRVQGSQAAHLCDARADPRRVARNSSMKAPASAVTKAEITRGGQARLQRRDHLPGCAIFPTRNFAPT